MYTVIVLEGKRDEAANTVYYKNFDSVEKALKFIDETDDLESKYWTKCVAVAPGKEIDTYNEFYNE